MYGEKVISRQTIEKWCDMFKNGDKGIVLVIYNNATPYSAKVTKELLQKFKWEVWEHPPGSPDLSPCDFHVFGPIKNELA